MSRRSSNTAATAKEAPKASVSAGAARARKPTKRYVEDSSWETLKNLSRRAANKQERKKEKFIEGQGQTKDRWYRYKSKISQLVRSIVKDQHTVDTYENDQKASKTATVPKDEVSKCNARIESNKRAILRLFEELDAENSEHKRWEKLAQDYDDDNSVDVEDIMCSRCNKPDEEGNDIVFCDRVSCLRAYHQKCLDPPFRANESHPDSAWFCRQCACMDDCLDMVGELLDADCNHYSQLFPELRASSSTGTATAAAADEGSDSEEDADYAPSHSGSDDEGDMDEDGEGSADGSDDPEGDDDASEADNSDIEQDEVDGLLRDADLTAAQVAQSLNSRGLRARRGNKAGDASNDPSTTAEGAADVGKEVVVVRRGEMVVGTVTAFRYAPAKGSSSSSSKAAAAKAAAEAAKAQRLEDGLWTVQFEDDSAPTEVDFETVKKYLALFGEYRQMQRSEEASAVSAQKSQLEEQGRLDAANVLVHKRPHRRTDYVTLNKQMFGDEADGETDDGDAPYPDNGADEQHSQRRGGNNSDSSDSDGDNWYERAGRLAASALSAAARQLTNSVTSSHFADTLAGVTVGTGGYADIDFEEELRRSRGRPLGSKDRSGLSDDGLTASGKKRGRPLGCKDTKPRVRSGKPLGRPRKHPLPEPTIIYYNSDSEASESERVMRVVVPEKRKRGRPRIHPLKEPSDVPRKRGRPRIHPLPDPSIPVVPKKRGRPPGSKTKNRTKKEGQEGESVEGEEQAPSEGGGMDHALLQEVQDAESLSEAD